MKSLQEQMREILGHHTTTGEADHVEKISDLFNSRLRKELEARDGEREYLLNQFLVILNKIDQLTISSAHSTIHEFMDNIMREKDALHHHEEKGCCPTCPLPLPYDDYKCSHSCHTKDLIE